MPTSRHSRLITFAPEDARKVTSPTAYFSQLAVLRPDKYSEFPTWDPERNLFEWVELRVLELTYTACDLSPFAQDLGDDGPPFRWDEERRFAMRAELDAAFFHLYGINRDDVDYIMETFPIVKRKDIQQYGTFRTKDLILQIYDAMTEATRIGVSTRPSSTHPQVVAIAIQLASCWTHHRARPKDGADGAPITREQYVTEPVDDIKPPRPPIAARPATRGTR